MQALGQLQEILISLQNIRKQLIPIIRDNRGSQQQSQQSEKSSQVFKKVNYVFKKYYSLIRFQFIGELRRRVEELQPVLLPLLEEERAQVAKIKQESELICGKELEKIKKQVVSEPTKIEENPPINIQSQFAKKSKQNEEIFESQSIQTVQIANQQPAQEQQSQYIVVGQDLKYLKAQYLDFNFSGSEQTVKEDKSVQFNKSQEFNCPVCSLNPPPTQKIQVVQGSSQTQSPQLRIQKVQGVNIAKRQKNKQKKHQIKDQLQVQLQSIIYGKHLLPFVQEYLLKTQSKQCLSPLMSPKPETKQTQTAITQGDVELNQNKHSHSKKSELINFLTKSKDLGQLSIDEILQSTYQRLVVICFDTLLFSLKNMEYFLPLGSLTQLLKSVQNEEIFTLKSQDLRICGFRIQRCCKDVMKKMRELRKQLKKDQLSRNFFDINQLIKLKIKNLEISNEIK